MVLWGQRIMIEILKKIKKLKVKELKLLDEKLKIILKKKKDQWKEENPVFDPENFVMPPVLDIEDIYTALMFCIYHFKGGRVESASDDEMCPCNCHCESCEMIPESEVLVRMQEIGQTMTEENVMNEFVEKHGKYIEEINGR